MTTPFRLIGKGAGFLWKKLPRWISILLVAVVVVSTCVGIDASSRLFMSDEPGIVSYEGDLTQSQAVVGIGGAGVDSLDLFAGAMKTLQENADDAFVVTFAEYAFDAQKVIDLVIKKVKPYDSVVFVGVSMGGLLAYDIIKKLRDQGDTRHFGVVLIDSPAVTSDVNLPQFQKDAAGWPFGAISNLFAPSGFNRDAPAFIAKDANRQQLEALWTSYETWPFSCKSDQGGYTLEHPPLESLPDVTWYFIQSEEDAFVYESAHGNWEKTQGLMPIFIVKQGVHASLLNQPSVYNGAIANGIQHVA